MHDKRELDVLDILNILSFYIGVKNLDENLSQTTAGNLLDKAVGDIHKHLEEQDNKIDMILKELSHDKN